MEPTQSRLKNEITNRPTTIQFFPPVENHTIAFIDKSIFDGMSDLDRDIEPVKSKTVATTRITYDMAPDTPELDPSE
jgi:hypothetical protein